MLEHTYSSKLHSGPIPLVPQAGGEENISRIWHGTGPKATRKKTLATSEVNDVLADQDRETFCENNRQDQQNLAENKIQSYPPQKISEDNDVLAGQDREIFGEDRMPRKWRGMCGGTKIKAPGRKKRWWEDDRRRNAQTKNAKSW